MYSKLVISNGGAYFVLVLVNILALCVPFFGRTPADVSYIYANMLTPANFTFKIWSVVYLLLAVFIWMQLGSQKNSSKQQEAEVIAIGPWFLVSCLLNIAWLLTWQSLCIFVSFWIIFVYWLILMWLYYKLAHVPMARWQFTIPMSIYFAWICVATLASLNVFIIHCRFAFFGLSEEVWTASLIACGIVGTLLMLYLNKDIVFTAVLIWAFFGMYVKNIELAPQGNMVTTMSIFAMSFLGVVGLVVGINKFRNKSSLST